MEFIHINEVVMWFYFKNILLLLLLLLVLVLVYTTQVNSTFCVRLLASSDLISQVLYIHLRAAIEKQNGFCRCIVTNKVTL